MRQEIDGIRRDSHRTMQLKDELEILRREKLTMVAETDEMNDLEREKQEEVTRLQASVEAQVANLQAKETAFEKDLGECDDEIREMSKEFKKLQRTMKDDALAKEQKRGRGGCGGCCW